MRRRAESTGRPQHSCSRFPPSPALAASRARIGATSGPAVRTSVVCAVPTMAAHGRHHRRHSTQEGAAGALKSARGHSAAPTSTKTRARVAAAEAFTSVGQRRPRAAAIPPGTVRSSIASRPWHRHRIRRRRRRVLRRARPTTSRAGVATRARGKPAAHRPLIVHSAAFGRRERVSPRADPWRPTARASMATFGFVPGGTSCLPPFLRQRRRLRHHRRHRRRRRHARKSTSHAGTLAPRCPSAAHRRAWTAASCESLGACAA